MDMDKSSGKSVIMKVESATALVTGGAVRIGRAICEVLAEAGCNVVVHYNQSQDEAIELVDELGARGILAVPVRGLLGSEESAENLIADAWAKAGRVDILVNSAAVFHKDGLMAANEKKLVRELTVNAFAPIFLTQAFARRLTDTSPDTAESIIGKVVNLLDRRITSNEVGCLPYLLSKKMLADFTRNAALELAPRFSVNAVAPGAVLPPPGKGEHYLRDLAGDMPLGRAGSPRDVADAVLYLLKSDVITGQTVFVDGGQHLT